MRKTWIYIGILIIVIILVLFLINAISAFMYGNFKTTIGLSMFTKNNLQNYKKSDIKNRNLDKIIDTKKTNNVIHAFFLSKNQFITDKGTLHDYIPHYERLMRKKKHQDINLLEIGVFKGGSIAMWREYFSDNSNIHGIDIVSTVPRFLLDSNIYIHILNSHNETSVKQALGSLQFDFIIDDGDHRANSQKRTFDVIWPYLTKNGIYFIEDVTNPIHNDYYKKFGNVSIYDQLIIITKT